MAILASFLAGLVLLGLGLIVSSMANPAKVIGFLEWLERRRQQALEDYASW